MIAPRPTAAVAAALLACALAAPAAPAQVAAPVTTAPATTPAPAPAPAASPAPAPAATPAPAPAAKPAAKPERRTTKAAKKAAAKRKRASSSRASAARWKREARRWERKARAAEREEAAEKRLGERYGEDTPVDLDEGAAAPAAKAPPSTGGSIVRTIVGLAIVIAVIYGLTWILRQLKAGREGQASGRGLRAEATIPLGPGRSLHLVRAGHELLLLGVAEQGVTAIRTYTEEEARAAGLLAEEPAETAAEDGVPVAAGAAAAATAARARAGAMTIGEALTRLRAWTVRT